MGDGLITARRMYNSLSRNHRSEPDKGVQYDDLGQGEYVRLVTSFGASSAGLVMLKSQCEVGF